MTTRIIIASQEVGKINISIEPDEVWLSDNPDQTPSSIDLPVDVLVHAVQHYIELTGLDKFQELMEGIKNERN
jgi:hypothetical protein